MDENQRKRSIIMSGKKCSYSSSKHIFDCHCNECHDNIKGYLGKEKKKIYIYTGKFAPEYIRGKQIIVDKFSTDEHEKTSSCEAFIHLADSDYGYEWIPRNEIENNLISI